MAPVGPPMVIAMVELYPEMIAEGVEAMREAQKECFSEGEIVKEIYLAMYGAYIKALDRAEKLH